MIETETPADRVYVIHPQISGRTYDVQARLEEACGLAEALDLELAGGDVTHVRAIDPGRFFGSGKAEQIRLKLEEEHAAVCVVDAKLSPVQQRNLEKTWNVKVVDRTGLILEIFGRRARTKEGRLQVELARLAYERSRLVRTWTHLERQRGGGGFLAGPGETQIETDRRLLDDKMAKLRRELDDVRRTRALHRKQRQDVPYPLVALVGYTNAGKSTLFNRITGASVLAKDMPFATLDTTVRAFETPNGIKALMSDTVGFIIDLPTELIAAFRATLEEVRDADVLIHVMDVSAADFDLHRTAVETILDDLEAGVNHGQTVIEVFNKIDLWDDDLDEAPPKKGEGVFETIAMSALTGEGTERFMAAIERALLERARVLTVELGPGEGKAHAWLHRHGAVLRETSNSETGAISMTVRLTPEDAGRFAVAFPELGREF
ncbi:MULTISPECIES: GTPase HflX [Hyphobacterium]|uniref:GTPase HflX n=1 Tax=Hyphobacterium vulgare TaxID=1736751 RepID=A0ABV6ZT62_9PROT